MVYYYRKNKQLVDETVYPHPIISYSVPIREEGRIIGVITADISLVWLSKYLHEIKQQQLVLSEHNKAPVAFWNSPDIILILLHLQK